MKNLNVQPSADIEKGALSIRNRLSYIQKVLVAPKAQTNTFGKYSFRSCEDILLAIKPLLNFAETLTISDDMVLLGERYYLKATVVFANTDGEEMSATAFAREADAKKGMDAAQVTGATSSYARKYALNALFAIDDVKDQDTMDNRAYEVQKSGVDMDQVNKSAEAISAAIAADEPDTVAEAWMELNEEEANVLWRAKSKGGPFTNQERIYLKSDPVSRAKKARFEKLAGKKGAGK
jgi:hypothetical protein